MSDLVHHHTAAPYTGGEEDGFDVIETNEISVWHHSMQVDYGFDTVRAAIERADELAAEFDRRNDPDGAAWLKQQFEFEWCGECGRDHRHHTAVPVLGNWFARCDLPAVEDDENGEIVVNPEGYAD